MSETTDCVVVGAGFAGLCAANQLQSEGASVAVLEARERLGGRIAPGQVAGLDVDFGGMWLGPTQTRITALAREVGVELYAQHVEGRGHVHLNGRPARIPGDAMENAVPLLPRLELLKLRFQLNRLGRRLSIDEPWAMEGAEDLDRMTVTEWAERHLWSRSVQNVMRQICRTLLCGEPEEISMLFFLFYMQAGGGLEVLFGMGGDGAQAHLVRGGVHQVAVELGRRLERSVTLGAPVRIVAQGDDGVVLRTDQGEVEARYAIFTTPPGLTEKISFEPSLDDRKAGLLSRQKMGSCIKVWIAYDRPFWREQGSNALFLSDRDDFTPISDATPPGTDLGVLAGFFDAEPARRWTGRSAEERKAEVLGTLARGLGDEALNPVDYVEKDWCEDPWSEGCYGAYMRPGTMTEFGPALRAPHGRIHWAGTETATIWSGYIEGAVRSGERAASEVLERLRD